MMSRALSEGPFWGRERGTEFPLYINEDSPEHMHIGSHDIVAAKLYQLSH